MGVHVERANVEVRRRSEGYREFRCTPTHWYYDAPFSREALYTEGTSNNLDLNNDADFWSASDAALRVRHVPAAELDIREMVLLATRRSTDYNAPKPWVAAGWVNDLESEWSGSATHLHPFARLPESGKKDLWRHAGMLALPLARRLTYPLQTGVSILDSDRQPRGLEPWHTSGGVWYSWSTLEKATCWQRRQEAEAQASIPEEGCLLLFLSHRWESPDHPDPTGRQLEAIRAGLTMALAGAAFRRGRRVDAVRTARTAGALDAIAENADRATEPVGEACARGRAGNAGGGGDSRDRHSDCS